MSNHQQYFEENAFDLRTEDEVQRSPFIKAIDSLPVDARASILKWRMRPAWMLPQSWQEVAVFVGFALAIKFAYNVFYSPDDVAPGDFPVECINPLKRRLGGDYEYDSASSAAWNEEQAAQGEALRRHVVDQMMEGDQGNVVSQDQIYEQR